MPTPESVFGFRPGADNKLNSWAEVTRYFERLAATSDRVRLATLGKTTEGRPFLAATISAPENLKALARYREINNKLTDPRRLKGGEAEANALIREGKTIVVVTCGVHSTEVASYLGGQLIAYRLASASDAETLRILQNTIILFVPSLNPDGVDIVKAWFDAGMRGPAPLYQKYVGHDDNRDWVGFTQVESQLTVDQVLNPWRPQILHDIHQQGSNGPRIFLPPYTEPVEPNIPRRLIEGYTELGLAMAADLTAQGFTGVINGSDTGEGYDAWSPLRQYAHFHNGVRLLSETAGARIAAPITVNQVRPDKPLPNFPRPWPAGTWTIGDATRYVTAAAFALLNHAAVHRERWLRRAYETAREAVAPRKPGEAAAYLLPPSPNRAPLLTILHRGAVELEYLTEPQTVEGTLYPKDTALVRLDQPFGGYANALLSVQHYPDLRDSAGKPIRPYDVTAHTLPLLLGTTATRVTAPLRVRSRPAAPPPETPVRLETLPKITKRIGLLRSNTIDEGWARWVLDLHRVPYTLVEAGALRPGVCDVLLLPTALPRTGGDLRAFVEQGGTVIALNQASGSVIAALDLPLRDVTLGTARSGYYVPGSLLRTELDTTHPLARGLERLSIAWAEGSPAFEVTDPAKADDVRVVARYPETEPLLSGWLLGGERLKGKAALVEVRVGKGKAILFGFKPNYRGLSLATYPLLFNALADTP